MFLTSIILQVFQLSLINSSPIPPQSSKCMSILTKSRFGYNCLSQGLETIPSVIPPHTQVLFLSFNKIQSITQNSFPDLPLLQALTLGAQVSSGSLSVGKSAFIHLPNLTSLDLGSNQNIRLHPEAFEGLSRLEVLLLDNNRLDESVLESGLFRDLTSLRKLDLSFNQIRRLRPDPSFLQLSFISSLILKLNKIKFLCGEDLQNLQGRRLELLDLSSNPLQISDTASCTNPFKNITIGTLDISSMAWDSKKVDYFFRTISGTQVKHVKMSHTASLGSGYGFYNLRDPDENTFSGLNASNIQVFDLSHGFISQLVPQLFSSFPKLLSLDLSSNKISRISTGAFSGLGHLVNLNLSGNLLGDLMSNNLQGLGSTTLKALDLSSNNLGVIQYGALDRFTALESLNLKDNALKHIPSVKLPSVTLVLLKENRITDTFGLTSFCPNATFLDISSNRLTDLTFLWEILELESLQYLFLGRNQLSRCSPARARKLSTKNSLLQLDLSDNALGQVWKSGQCGDIFKNLGQLESLNLARNQISSLPDDLFQGLTNLHTLDLSGNNFRFITSEMFMGLTSLKSLNLAKNSFVTLSPSFVEPLDSLESIDLSEITLICDCELKELWNWIEDTKVNVHLGGRELSCIHSTSTFHETPLVTYLKNCQ
ncbi:toll-like receptor 5 [Rhinophrynus dorsalis]